MNNAVSAAAVSGPIFGFDAVGLEFQPAARERDADAIDFGEVMTATLAMTEALFAYTPSAFVGADSAPPVIAEKISVEKSASGGEFDAFETPRTALLQSEAYNGFSEPPRPGEIATVSAAQVISVNPVNVQEALAAFAFEKISVRAEKITALNAQTSSPDLGGFQEAIESDAFNPSPFSVKSDIGDQPAATARGVSETTDGGSILIDPREATEQTLTDFTKPNAPPTDASEISLIPVGEKPIVTVKDAPTRSGPPVFPAEFADEKKTAPTTPSPTNDGGESEIPARIGQPMFPAEFADEKKTAPTTPSPTNDGGESEIPTRIGQPMFPAEFLRERKKASERIGLPVFGPERRPPISLRPIQIFLEASQQNFPDTQSGPSPSAELEGQPASASPLNQNTPTQSAGETIETMRATSDFISDAKAFQTSNSLSSQTGEPAVSTQEASEETELVYRRSQDTPQSQASGTDRATPSPQSVSLAQLQALVVATNEKTKETDGASASGLENTPPPNTSEFSDASGLSLAKPDAPTASPERSPVQSPLPTGAAAFPPLIWANVKTDAPLRAFHFSIKPEELGEIDVNLTKDRHGNVNAELIASTSETYVELQRDIGKDLHAILENAGVERIEVRLGANAESRNGHSDRQASDSRDQTRFSHGASVEASERAADQSINVGVVRRLLSLRI